MQPIKEWCNALLDLFFPRCCVVCNGALAKGEACLCARCNMELPRTYYHLLQDNPVERLFWGKIPLCRASSYFFYQKGGRFRQILFRLKYKGEKEIGEVMGRYMAAELLPTGFFEGISVIVPVPLHPKRQKQRGYNQSEWIARGIATMTHLPIDSMAVERCKYTGTQTHKALFERWDNVEGVFRLRSPQSFVGKHILLIDDVLTTGATTVACASAFCGVEGVRFSILTLAVAV